MNCNIVKIFFLTYIISTTLCFSENVPELPKVIAGMKGGLNYTNFTTDETYVYDPEFIKGMSFGGFLNFGINKYFSLQLEVNYIEKGSEGFEDFFEFYESESYWDTGLYFKEKVLYDFELKYVEIPVIVKYHPAVIFKIKPNLYCSKKILSTICVVVVLPLVPVMPSNFNFSSGAP